MAAIAEAESSLKMSKIEPIYFIDEDFLRRLMHHRDALVVALDINEMVVCWVLVDTDNSVNVLYYDTFTKMGLERG